MAVVRANGYTTLKQSDYDPKATLRVLIARPVGDAAGGHRAFFFSKDTFLGNDATNPSTKLTVARAGKLTVMLSYGVYAAGRPAGRPERSQAGALPPGGHGHPRARHDPAR